MKRIMPPLGVLLMLASCATIPTPATETAPSPLPGRGASSPPATGGSSSGGQAPASPLPGRVGSTPGGGPTATQTPTVVDSLPSREAIEVLKSIPEPLSPGERIPAPPRSELAADSGGSPTDSTVADSSATAGGRDSVQVPTPSPTVPLGDRPGSLIHPADSLAASPAREAAAGSPSTPAGSGGAAGPAPTSPQAPGASPPRSVAPDSCWRVQVAAKPEADKAKALRDAAQSQLLVPMVVELEKGLHKVRTRDCLGPAAAELLRRRALAAGFAGTFRFKGSPR